MPAGASVEKMFHVHAVLRAALYCSAQLDPLHSNPRFMELMRQVNLLPAASAALAPAPRAEKQR